MKLALLGTGYDCVGNLAGLLRNIDGIELVAILSTPRSLENQEPGWQNMACPGDQPL